MLSPSLAIVDEQLSHHLPGQWLTSLNIEKKETGKHSEEAITVIEAPRELDLLVDLIKKLKPKVVVTGIAQYESATRSSFEHLLDVTREIECRLFLDISDHFELSSSPNFIVVFKYLAGSLLPSHVAIVCSLLKNQVYTDLEVAFVISEQEAMFKALSKTGELLQGYTSIISQYYYGCLFHELRFIQFVDPHAPTERTSEKTAAKVNDFSTSTISMLEDAELAVNESEGSSVVHMDVDQSFLPIIKPVKASIFESFARQNVPESETDVTPGIKKLVSNTYGFPCGTSTEFIYADSTAGLFSKLVLCCNQEGGTFCFPSGTNGNLVSAAKFLNANIANVQTKHDVNYKLTEKTLAAALESIDKPWVYISGPTINPTGLLYTNEEISGLLSICAKFGARVILDTSFSGVEFNAERFEGWNLGATLEKLSSAKSGFCVSLLGDLFFKMMVGGIKFGFLLIDQPSLIQTFHSFAGLSRPHSTIKYSVKKLLQLAELNDGDLLNAMSEQREILRSRYEQLKHILDTCGWKVLEAQGGLSILAKPSAYLGKKIKIDKEGSTQEMTLDDTNIREAILNSTGLSINSASWTGIKGYCRFTIALEESDFTRALGCISKFKTVVDAQHTYHQRALQLLEEFKFQLQELQFSRRSYSHMAIHSQSIGNHVQNDSKVSNNGTVGADGKVDDSKVSNYGTVGADGKFSPNSYFQNVISGKGEEGEGPKSTDIATPIWKDTCMDIWTADRRKKA